MTVSKYHPALVVLHWLLALLLLVALAMGTWVLKELPNASPDKIGALRGHMIAGGLIGVLMLTRLGVRLFSTLPPPVSTGMPWADRASRPVHLLLYGLVFAMVGSGVAMSIHAQLPQIVFGGQGALPASFDGMTARAVHGAVATLLMLGMALHIGAGLYHAFIRRDGVMARMGFGRR